MKGKHIAGILVAACFGAIIAAGHGDISQPASGGNDVAAVFTGVCVDSTRPANISEVVYPFGTESDGCGPGIPTPIHGVPIPSKGILQILRVTGGPEFGPGEGSVITVFVNGAPTSLSCTVDSSEKCADTTHKVRVYGGDEVSATFTPAKNRDSELLMSFGYKIP